MNWIRKKIDNYIYRIDFDKYWKRRIYISSKVGGIKRMWFLFYLKRVESQFCAHTGLGMGNELSPCCKITEKLNLPHGLAGIIIARNVVFEGCATIYQHVTIEQGNPNNTTYIGDGAIIGAGAVILKNVRVGSNSFIGANAVVTKNVPDNAIVAGVPARIIKKE